MFHSTSAGGARKHDCLPTARRRDRIESNSTCRPLRNTEESRVHDESGNQKEPYKMMRYNWTNSSKVIKAQVNTVQMELQRLLDQNLLGIYLHGSPALGGLQPIRSDIVMLVVNRPRMDPDTKRAVIATLLRISRMPCPLDIDFLAEQDIFPFQHPLPCDLHYEETCREQYEQDLRTGAWKHWNDTVERDRDLTISIRVLHQC